MFNRKILKNLREWALRPNRKPLVLRGARQVGKTTLVNQFGKEFHTYIALNLEIATNRKVFEVSDSLNTLLDAIFFLKSIPKNNAGKTLLFIDEIQKCAKAVEMLRYFHEEAPHIHVIAAGSLLETLLDTHSSFPVGRVEFLLMHPFSFEEFLDALGEVQAKEALCTIPTPIYSHDKLISLYHKYMMVGGMPEAVQIFVNTGDVLQVDPIHEALLLAYLEDVEKYAPSHRMALIVRHCIQHAFYEACGRIRYEGFGNSNYLSRDIKEALHILQKAFLIQVMHPTTSLQLPIIPDTKKSPRLQLLDTGLVVFRTGTRKALFSATDLSAVFAGRILEHVVGQELYATMSSPLSQLHFWARDKSQSNAEVDYVIDMDGMQIPIEVKSGPNGRLRSLHAYMDAAPIDIAIRLHQGVFSQEQVRSIAGKEFKLISLPYYQAGMLRNIKSFYNLPDMDNKLD